MARTFDSVRMLADVGVLLGSSSGQLLLGTIIMSIPIISMVIFACVDSKAQMRRGGVGGGGCGGGGGGYRGGGGGYGDGGGGG
ncbi:hypothetical protein ACB094_06G150500 [Castanea mollissima]